MAVDVEKATGGFATLHELWAAVLTIIVACAMLWAKAGYVMFAPLLFIVALIGSTSAFFSSPPFSFFHFLFFF
jgi:type IV secretory pathway VirB2 component (pilin)